MHRRVPCVQAYAQIFSKSKVFRRFDIIFKITVNYLNITYVFKLIRIFSEIFTDYFKIKILLFSLIKFLTFKAFIEKEFGF